MCIRDRVKKAEPVAETHVAGVEPPVLESLGGAVLVAPVTLHHVGAADYELADFAAAEFLALVIHHLDVHTGDGHADRPGPPDEGVHRDDRGRLNQPVSFDEAAAEGLEHLDLVPGHGIGAGYPVPDAGEVVLLWMELQEDVPHRRDPRHDGGLVLLYVFCLLYTSDAADE